MKQPELVGTFTAQDESGCVYRISILQTYVALPSALDDKGPPGYGKGLLKLVTDQGERVVKIANKQRTYLLRRERDILLMSNDPNAL